jgi:hypothetical protein
MWSALSDAMAWHAPSAPSGTQILSENNHLIIVIKILNSVALQPLY